MLMKSSVYLLGIQLHTKGLSVTQGEKIGSNPSPYVCHFPEEITFHSRPGKEDSELVEFPPLVRLQ